MRLLLLPLSLLPPALSLLKKLLTPRPKPRKLQRKLLALLLTPRPPLLTRPLRLLRPPLTLLLRLPTPLAPPPTLQALLRTPLLLRPLRPSTKLFSPLAMRRAVPTGAALLYLGVPSGGGWIDLAAFLAPPDRPCHKDSADHLAKNKKHPIGDGQHRARRIAV